MNELKAEISTGMSAPLIQDKVYFAPYVDYSWLLFGCYADIGLMYTQHSSSKTLDKTWLGYFIDFDCYAKIPVHQQWDAKAGLGYAFHHLANVDQSLRYHQLYALTSFDFYPIRKLKLSYRFQFPLIKSKDMDLNQPFVQTLTIGYRF